MITLFNDFHQTQVNLRPVPLEGDDGTIGKLSENQIKRARRILCGISGCICGNDLGMRGPQNYEIAPVIDRCTGQVTGAWVYNL